MKTTANYQKRKEFARLYRMGKYTQRDIAKMVGIREATASQWVRELAPILLCATKRNLTEELDRVTALQKYAANRDTIRDLISDIERVERLITRAYNASN